MGDWQLLEEEATETAKNAEVLSRVGFGEGGYLDHVGLSQQLQPNSLTSLGIWVSGVGVLMLSRRYE